MLCYIIGNYQGFPQDRIPACPQHISTEEHFTFFQNTFCCFWYKISNLTEFNTEKKTAPKKALVNTLGKSWTNFKKILYFPRNIPSVPIRYIVDMKWHSNSVYQCLMFVVFVFVFVFHFIISQWIIVICTGDKKKWTHL